MIQGSTMKLLTTTTRPRAKLNEKPRNAQAQAGHTEPQPQSHVTERHLFPIHTHGTTVLSAETRVHKLARAYLKMKTKIAYLSLRSVN